MAAIASVSSFIGGGVSCILCHDGGMEQRVRFLVDKGLQEALSKAKTGEDPMFHQYLPSAQRGFRVAVRIHNGKMSISQDIPLKGTAKRMFDVDNWKEMLL